MARRDWGLRWIGGPRRYLAPVLLVLLLFAPAARAEVSPDRFGAGGYFRIMTRPDFQGGDSRLGLWNLYGRLLNEGPWAALELRLALLRRTPGRDDVWTEVHTKVEGGSFANTDPGGGRLDRFNVSQLYVLAGNILLRRVTWQLGTLESYFGDLGLYDMRPAQIFSDTIGLSARYEGERLDLLLGLGDSGFFVRGTDYSTVLTFGGALRLRLGRHLELGAGGQVGLEPKVAGNRFAPYATPGVRYEDFYRGEVMPRFIQQYPGREADFYTLWRPEPTSSLSYKVIGYLGFGDLGPLRWNNFFINFLRRHPDNIRTERYNDKDYTIFVTSLTDERYELNLGNEMQLRLIPNRLDAVWGVVVGHHTNLDNAIAAGEDNRTFFSTVLRLQGYLTETLHLLLESSLAEERIANGNLYREHFDSVFRSSQGRADSRGLEFGDTARRTTWQLKVGPVLNPLGLGIYMRPSLRLLYGLQYSNVHNAFRSSYDDSLDQYNALGGAEDRHWHQVVALEAEAWF